MTTKEKAQELVNKMLDKQEYSDVYQERGIISWSAKQCALIAVDEMLSNDGWSSSRDEWDRFKKYFEEVKQEIQKL